ncbi:DEAD/DEAH box helicase family protein [Enterobacter cloacae]|uniref:DEAD/DEAH box helicase family protein n=1 Tax=Enterobacter cloacae TaxID=550 RepID=UPI00191C3413|nr:DEAD/DEAH box helicase family protein [Enterobacter cloacae]HEI8778032.1 DEAD/DEAH box helicase family protein [Enterobacter cloacae]HEI8779209.1 DEAD/DEAH box helicase family protein [Enterobacter cloacae]
MTDVKTLSQVLIEELGKRTIEGTKLPDSITGNLNPAFPMRPYQERAFKFFKNYWEEAFDGKPRQNHQLLFHMATGSGKTLMMAGLISYLYEKGYRNFLFFVNNSNIIEKTRDNFLNSVSKKYLFAETISFGDKRVAIREVENFQSVNPDDINIVFSTIQGLHMALNTPKENSLTYDDFENQKIVLISDEAHHINADTKKGKEVDQEELFGIVSWEGTVEKIFRANTANLLLEFTATVDFSDDNLKAKYLPKLLFDYPLKEFRKDGYSKEVKVLQADLPLIDRALQAVLLSQYRRKIFEKNRLHIKPVIMFKSKTIKDSQADLLPVD